MKRTQWMMASLAGLLLVGAVLLPGEARAHGRGGAYVAPAVASVSARVGDVWFSLGAPAVIYPAPRVHYVPVYRPVVVHRPAPWHHHRGHDRRWDDRGGCDRRDGGGHRGRW